MAIVAFPGETPTAAIISGNPGPGDAERLTVPAGDYDVWLSGSRGMLQALVRFPEFPIEEHLFEGTPVPQASIDGVAITSSATVGWPLVRSSIFSRNITTSDQGVTIHGLSVDLAEPTNYEYRLCRYNSFRETASYADGCPRAESVGGSSGLLAAGQRMSVLVGTADTGEWSLGGVMSTRSLEEAGAAAFAGWIPLSGGGASLTSSFPVIASPMDGVSWRVFRSGLAVRLQVACKAAISCSVLLATGSWRRSLTLSAGARRTVSLPIGRMARRSLLRGRPARLRIRGKIIIGGRIEERTMSVTIRCRRARSSQKVRRCRVIESVSPERSGNP